MAKTKCYSILIIGISCTQNIILVSIGIIGKKNHPNMLTVNASFTELNNELE